MITMHARNEDTHQPDALETGDDHRLKVDANVSGVTREIHLLSDPTGGNDMHFAVPGGYEYQILWVWVEYTADGNAGNRQVEVSLRDPDAGEIGSVLAGAVQGAGLTRNYMFGPDLADLTAFRDTQWLMTPFPSTVYLTPGQLIRVFDNNLVSPNDNMVVRVQISVRSL